MINKKPNQKIGFFCFNIYIKTNYKIMKHLKTFESYSVNEEVSLKGLAPIIASIFFTLNSLDASAIPSGGANGARRFNAAATSEVRSLASKIERDLEKLKSQTTDPELLDLIESVQSLQGWQYVDGMDHVKVVVDKLNAYMQSQGINEPLVNDTLQSLSSGDAKMIQAHYSELLQKYEDLDQHEFNMALILIIVCTLIASGFIYLGLTTYRHGLPG